MKKPFKISISIQISIFLIIIAFIPVAIMMALNTYEKQQLSMLENSNVQQGRIIAAMLETCSFTEEADVQTFSNSLLDNMDGKFDSRIRILDSNGKLLADSATVNQPLQQKTLTKNFDRSNDKTEASESVIYRMFSFPVRVYRKFFRPPVALLYDNAEYYSQKSVYDGEEIKTALSGKYGAATRISSGEQVSVTIYSALPVIQEDAVTGVVLVSRSTYKILQNLYELRLDLAKIFLRSLIVVVLVAVFLAFRISWPLKKLSRQTSECADKKGRIMFTAFTGKKRRDEIGDLSRSFSSLIERLNKRIKFSQAFSSDISHEFKNPLTAIRSSAELLSDSNLPEDSRKELSVAVLDEVDHLQTLLTGVRNISRIDAGDDLQEKLPQISLNSFVSNEISRLQKIHPSVEYIFRPSEEEIKAEISEDYLSRICENLLDNAADFGTKVMASICQTQEYIQISVEDNGKGIAPEAREKIFDRFYSERAEGQRTNHTGLGLSIVKAVVDAVEGKIEISQSNTLDGACFTVSFPK